jgi:hypothetical protein
MVFNWNKQEVKMSEHEQPTIEELNDLAQDCRDADRITLHKGEISADLTPTGKDWVANVLEIPGKLVEAEVLPTEKAGWITYYKSWDQFTTDELNKPGVLVELDESERFLIGDMNTLAGYCDDCTQFSGSEIISRYKVMLTHEELLP